MTFRPSARNTGFTLSTSDASPPTMMSSVASRAKMTPPITGASTTSMPRGLNASASERVAVGSQVLMSITTAPLARPAAMQFSVPSPSTTCRTTLSSGSIVITASAPCAASTSDAALFPPCRATNACIAPGRMSCTVTSNPFLTRCPAIGAPMFPIPTKPIFLIVISNPTPILAFPLRGKEHSCYHTAPRAVIGQIASTRPPRTQTYWS